MRFNIRSDFFFEYCCVSARLFRRDSRLSAQRSLSGRCLILFAMVMKAQFHENVTTSWSEYGFRSLIPRPFFRYMPMLSFVVTG